MAQNENINNNNKGSLRENRIIDNGRTESDATHYRLRSDLHPLELITCFSCGESFQSTSLLQVCEHYSEREHRNFYANCNYCKGKVHQYQTKNSLTLAVRIYHDCFRWKTGIDK